MTTKGTKTTRQTPESTTKATATIQPTGRKVTHQTSESTTKSTVNTEATTIKTTPQTTKSTTKATVTTLAAKTTVITSVETPPDITTVTEKDTATSPANINDDENTIPEETIEPPTVTNSIATTQTHKNKPGCYPHCSLPSTWETTVMGETRDFVQILRERYGDRVKILRDTTHYPKNPIYARKRLVFVPGRHVERRKHRY